MSERELAHRYALAAERLYPLVDPLVSNILDAAPAGMRPRARSISAMERSGGRLPGSREVAVCFADLVGFTRLGEEVPPDELGRLAVRLEALASEVAEPPVRLVKTIGDAAMLASPEPEPLLGAALALIDAADAEGDYFPQLRAGAALGPALLRAGDWFGRPVNLASRITSIARPGSLLAERELRESVERGLPLVVRRRAAPEGASASRSACSASARSRPERGARSARRALQGLPRRSLAVAVLELPQAPGRPPGGPQVVQCDGVLVGVHALPEALVAVGAQLARRAARLSSGARSSTLSGSR